MLGEVEDWGRSRIKGDRAIGSVRQCGIERFQHCRLEHIGGDAIALIIPLQSSKSLLGSDFIGQNGHHLVVVVSESQCILLVGFAVMALMQEFDDVLDEYNTRHLWQHSAMMLDSLSSGIQLQYL